jgi:hypothetical protein
MSMTQLGCSKASHPFNMTFAVRNTLVLEFQQRRPCFIDDIYHRSFADAGELSQPLKEELWLHVVTRPCFLYLPKNTSCVSSEDFKHSYQQSIHTPPNFLFSLASLAVKHPAVG